MPFRNSRWKTMINKLHCYWLANQNTGFFPANQTRSSSWRTKETLSSPVTASSSRHCATWCGSLLLMLNVLLASPSPGADGSLRPVSTSPPANRRVIGFRMPVKAEQRPTLGRKPATDRLRVELSIASRDRAALARFVQHLYDPKNAEHRRYLSPEEFTDRFGPHPDDYQAVIDFARSNRLEIVGRHSSRMVLEVEGSVADLEQAFQVHLQVYQDSAGQRRFFAPDAVPSVSTDWPILEVTGLSEVGPRRPKPSPAKRLKKPVAAFGSAPGGNLMGQDFRNAYAPGVALTGAGQFVGLVEFDSYLTSDVVAYEQLAGLPNVPLLNVPINGFVARGVGSVEVALDIEMAMSMAPGLAGIVVFEAPDSASILSLLDRLSTSNQISQFSCSWGLGSSPGIDAALLKMAAQGQTFFYASGDSDAYVNPQSIWMESPFGTSVGGTTLVTDGPAGRYASERVWNTGNTGSSGGVSDLYPIPDWQQGMDVTTNGGSSKWLNRPDVAMTADGIWAIYEGGQAGSLAGTSCAAPLWAGFMALVNQQSVASGIPPLGFLNPALYALALTTNYVACFHDVVLGDNTSPANPDHYRAGPGYDLCTGLGTPTGSNLITALCAIAAAPAILSQPTNTVVLRDGTGSLQTEVRGVPTLNYQWTLNGTNLPGATASRYTFNHARSADAGDYRLIAVNDFGSVTSSIATVAIVDPPALLTQPLSQAALAGASVSFGVTASGTGPLAYQWQHDGDNLPNNLILRVAGTGTAGFAGDGGSALNASFNAPLAVALDGKGTFYIADTANNRLRRIGADGLVHTVAGGGTAASFEGLAATNASLGALAAIVADARGNLYLADQSHGRVCKVDTNGIITTIAGNGGRGFSGDGAAATNATLNLPVGLAFDANGNLLIVDKLNNRIRKVDARGLITTVAGNGSFGYSGDGGPAIAASLKEPSSVAIDAAGNLYIADTFNFCLRKVSPTGTITTIAGTGVFGYAGDSGPATSAGLTSPRGLALDNAGNLYFADFNAQRIRKIDAQGIITTIAGTGQSSYSGEGSVGAGAALNQPNGLALDNHGNLYLADTGNHRIRKLLLYAGYPTLAINGVDGTNAGNYTVVISSPYGRVTSRAAKLLVATSANQPPITLNSPAWKTGLNQFAFNLNGAIGQTIIVDASTNLLDWTPLSTNVINALPFQVIDPAWTNHPQRYYRTR